MLKNSKKGLYTPESGLPLQEHVGLTFFYKSVKRHRFPRVHKIIEIVKNSQKFITCLQDVHYTSNDAIQ